MVRIWQLANRIILKILKFITDEIRMMNNDKLIIKIIKNHCTVCPIVNKYNIKIFIKMYSIITYNQNT